VRAYRDRDPEAVLRVSFLRGLRVIRVNLRRRDACLQTAQCRSLDSLRSLGMTVSRCHALTVSQIRFRFPSPASKSRPIMLSMFMKTPITFMT
jgi:hypothetical protein